MNPEDTRTVERLAQRVADLAHDLVELRAEYEHHAHRYQKADRVRIESRRVDNYRATTGGPERQSAPDVVPSDK